MSALNPFKKSVPAPLVDQLAAKSDELRSRQVDEAANAEALREASDRALVAASHAARQATAVEEAQIVLQEAGVTL